MLALFFWLNSYAELTDIEYKKQFKNASFAFCAVMEVVILIILILNPSIIGSQIPGEPYEYSHTTIDVLLILVMISGVLITGIIFSRKSMKSEDPKIKWKGRFLLISFISFTIGSILNGILHIFVPRSAFTLILIRSILISSAIEYYLGFFLPDFLMKHLS